MPRKYVIDVSVVRFRSWVMVNSMGGVVGWLNPKAKANPFKFTISKWPISTLIPCSLTRSLISHSTKNLTFYSSFRRNLIKLPIITTSRTFLFKSRENVLWNLGMKDWKVVHFTGHDWWLYFQFLTTSLDTFLNVRESVLVDLDARTFHDWRPSEAEFPLLPRP